MQAVQLQKNFSLKEVFLEIAFRRKGTAFACKMIAYKGIMAKLKSEHRLAVVNMCPFDTKSPGNIAVWKIIRFFFLTAKSLSGDQESPVLNDTAVLPKFN